VILVQATPAVAVKHHMFVDYYDFFMRAVLRLLLPSRRPVVLLNRDKSLKAFSYVRWSGFMLDNYCRLSKNGFVLYFVKRKKKV